MELNIGMNIKRLRLEKGLTQEQLADLLSVSTAAVSKWEARSTHPDITMLFPLAEVFGVRVDTLMGYDAEKTKADIDTILEEHHRLTVEGKYAERKTLIVEARKRYPQDYRIMSKYMWEIGGSHEELLEKREELTRICDCILQGCMLDDLRADAVRMKARLLHAKGDTEAALELLSQLPSWSAPIAKEQLFPKGSPEFRYWNKKNCYGLTDVMAIKLARIIQYDPSLEECEKYTRIASIAEAFGELAKREDLASFCIAEQAVYELLAGMLTMNNAPTEDVIQTREKQFASMEMMMRLALTDEVLNEQIQATYKTDNMIAWLVHRLRSTQHPQYEKLRKEEAYMDLLARWAR